MTCPSILELTTAPLSAATRRHVQTCPRCQALLAAWEAEPAPDERELEPPDVALPIWRPRGDPGSAPVVGAVHTVSAPGEDVLLLALVIDSNDEQATVMPLSTEVRWAADWDVRLASDVLGYPAMVEAWNPVDVLAEQLNEQLAVVPEAEVFVDLYDRSLAGADAPAGLDDGPAIVSADDPRLLFRTHERERVRPYAEPARVINMGESLGQVLRAMREERGRTPEELAEASGLPVTALVGMEEDREDLQAAVPVKSVGLLLAELQLPATDALLGYFEEAAFQNDRSRPVEQTAVFARRRRDARVRQPRAPEAERRKRAQAWVQRLRQELEGER